MLPQLSADCYSSFQYARPCRPDHENYPFQPGETITSQLPSPTHDAVQSIRIGLRDVASETARNIQQLSQATVEQALEMGQQLWRMQRDLKRKEYGAFLSILGWASAKARKFINLAKTFDGFEQSQLIRVELTTLLGLCSSRYSSVVAQLREVQDITQELVEQLIKQNRPARKPKQDPISGWKQNRVGGTRRYEIILHDEVTGLLIEQQAEAEKILPQKVIAEAVALLAQQKSADLEGTVSELETNPQRGIDEVQEHAQPRTEEVEELARTDSAFVENQQSPLDDEIAFPEASEPVDEVTIAQREVEQYLEEQASAIAVLPEGAVLAGEDETEIQWLLNASLHEVEAVIHSVPVRSAYRALYLLNQFQSGDTNRMELLEERVTEHQIAVGAVEPGQVTAKEKTWKDETQTRSKDSEQATDNSKAEPVSECLKLTSSDVQNLEPEQNNVLNEGDLVQINVTRGNNDKTWNGLLGYIQKFVSSTGKAVVLLQGDYRSKQFFKDELKLVEPVTAENLKATAVTNGAANCLPVTEVETEAEPQVFHTGDRVEIVSDRHGSDLVWQVGVIKVANAVGCVVEVLGRTVWFCVDELVLVSTTPQAAPEQEKHATRGIQHFHS